MFYEMKRFNFPHIPHPHLPHIPHPHLPHLQHRCPITGNNTPIANRIPLHAINTHVLDMIAKDHPNAIEAKWISREALNKYQTAFTQELIAQERGELTELEKQVVDAIHQQEILSVNVCDDIVDKATLGQRAADVVASFGGSWFFVIGFTFFILVWMSINTYWFFHPNIFDPYPFILLNLALSCLAALQAPIIMMSQNRQSTKDRMRDENEYKVSLKTEIEIRNLTSKIDMLMEKHWSHLVETQEAQTMLIQQLLDGQENNHPNNLSTKEDEHKNNRSE